MPGPAGPRRLAGSGRRRILPPTAWRTRDAGPVTPGTCRTLAGKNYRIRHKRLLVDGDDGIDPRRGRRAPHRPPRAGRASSSSSAPTSTRERIPLTIAAYDRAAGTITLIFQMVGLSTREMAALEEGDAFLDILGPLGTPIEVKKHDHPVICVGGGVGVAPIWPKVKELYELGNHVITIIGARTKRLLILEEELRPISTELIVTTDDGSYGRKGFVTYVLHEVIATHDGQGRRGDRGRSDPDDGRGGQGDGRQVVPRHLRSGRRLRPAPHPAASSA